MFSVIFSTKIKEKDIYNSEIKNTVFSLRKNYDWKLIFKAISPLILISIGAGLTIPFVNLFFNSVFGLNASSFSLLGSITAVFVFMFSLLVPTLRKQYGYWMTIVFVLLLCH